MSPLNDRQRPYSTSVYDVILLTNKMAFVGHVTVYEDTYEKLAFLLKSKEQDKAEGKREVVMWEYRVENKPESEVIQNYFCWK